jgi:negative regulator of replication initiation
MQKRVKIELDEVLVLKLSSMKQKIGETYSDVLRRILKVK